MTQLVASSAALARSIPRPSIAAIRKGRFPKPIKVGPGSSRWLREECEAALQGNGCGEGCVMAKFFPTYDFHPFCEIFPMIGATELDELEKDIEKYGLREQIVLFDNKILDGRNR